MANSRLKAIRTYLRPHWKMVSLGILSLFLVNIVSAYLPLLISNSIDQLKIGFSFSELSHQAIILLILASLMWGMRMLSRIMIFGAGRQVEFDLKQNIFQHLLTLEPSYFSNVSSGDLINRATSDVDNVRRLVGFVVLSFVNIIFAYGFTFPFMLNINVPLTLMAISVYPLMIITVQLFSGKMRDSQLQVQESLSELSELVQEDISGISLIKIYAQEEQERTAFRRKNQKLLKANLKLAQIRNLLFPMIEGISYIGLLILLWLGTEAIARGEITVGNFVALILYVEKLVFPTALLGFTITAFQRGEVSIDRIESIILAEAKVKNHETPINLNTEEIRGKITARNLTYNYPDSKVPALNNLNFTIQPGETIAIVGSIGSGKSTLANALPRLLDVAPGQLFIDGYDITQLSLPDLRKAIAYVPQESFLFSTTIKNNIRYGEPLEETAEIEYAAKQAQIHPEIINFPKKYETMVGERGITLSGGQRQRTSLARALMIDSPVLILDDALSSVDNETATEILNNLSPERDKRTVIFISHQLSAAANSDRILVMDQGKIVQSGTHDELVEQDGLYQSLWQQHRLKEVLN
ncbi:ABC-type multidrug transport system, ATPase and permease component [Xenococcus sp. PCC 7305]|uniref:ABC transporter ATP-binding protein n=1 Tax=Xenococcus sp. PCC 7305 TaxID=102125 RepID=UPI0002AD0347|nr:ABC transporter ATP-binding protein [Xenococcus sp. PCC 7305]ELS04357.1 ABC-type multidrug transport system, ATPase and permease component [Xenococcus sp. PCC 7305]